MRNAMIEADQTVRVPKADGVPMPELRMESPGPRVPGNGG
jgi:hypothetical protein